MHTTFAGKCKPSKHKTGLINAHVSHDGAVLADTSCRSSAGARDVIRQLLGISNLPMGLKQQPVACQAQPAVWTKKCNKCITNE